MKYVIVAIRLIFLAVAVKVLSKFAEVFQLQNEKTIRVRNGELQVPIIVLENDEGRILELRGMIHIGDEIFYKTHLEEIRDRERQGYVVTYEGVRPMSAHVRKKLTTLERQVLQQIDFVFKYRDELVAALKISKQGDILKPQEDWIRTDMTLRELVQRLAEEDAHLIEPELLKLIEWAESLKEGPESAEVVEKKCASIDRSLMNMPYSDWANRWLEYLSPNIWRTKQIILTERNGGALNTLYQILSSRNTVATWGAAHLPGMIEDLASRGFQETNRRWLTVYTSRSKKRSI